MSSLAVTNIKHENSLTDNLTLNSSGDVSFVNNPTLSGGTANGVPYLNGSKVLTSGSALTFDGTNLGIGTSSPSSFYSEARNLVVGSGSGGQGITIYAGTASQSRLMFADGTSGSDAYTGFVQYDHSTNALAFGTNGGSERMRIDSAGNVGIGTSSPAGKLDVSSEIRVTSGSNIGRFLTDGSNFYVGTRSNIPMRFETNSTTQMIVDTSGNVGIGTTSPDAKIVVEAGAVSQAAQTNDIAVFKNNANGYIKLYGPNTSTGGIAFGDSDDPYVGALTYSHSSDAMTMYVNNSERMRIDSSGNVGIGTSSPAYKLDIHKAGGDHLRLYAVDVSTSASADIDFFYLDGGGTPYQNAQISALAAGNAGNGNLVFSTRPTSGSLTERVRIDSSGNLLVGTTTQSLTTSRSTFFQSTAGAWCSIFKSTKDVSNNSFLQGFYNDAGSLVGYIVTANQSGTAYTSISDYRLKENITPMQNALGVVAQLNPVTYTWKADGSDGQGFIAHELQAVVPDCVTGEKDAVDNEGNPQYQGIDTSFLVATLTAAIQEQQAIIESLTARVSALEGN